MPSTEIVEIFEAMGLAAPADVKGGLEVEDPSSGEIIAQVAQDVTRMGEPQSGELGRLETRVERFDESRAHAVQECHERRLGGGAITDGKRVLGHRRQTDPNRSRA